MSSNYSRRRFLKTVVISAGAIAAGGLVGCGENHPDLIPPSSPSLPESPGLSGLTIDNERLLFPQSVASGDPRPDSIVLWTRFSGVDANPVPLTLEVSASGDFSRVVATSTIDAEEFHDFCLKVKVVGLDSGTKYFYRFSNDGNSTRTGQFRTAPEENSEENIKFAFLSCQDYVGRFYNTLTKLLEPAQDDLAFIVHLGDYIYETEGDPSFQTTGGARTITFDDAAGAIELPDSGGRAAASLSNYRQLYQTYRSDPKLQELHEKFAFINMWDDHEFSDDQWQDNGTYFDGRSKEKNTQRKKNAEQVFFEYQPVDVDPGTGAPAQPGEVNALQTFPFTILYRKFRFGKAINLNMADYRTFRPDHIIAEDAFPGSVIMEQRQVGDTLLVIPGDPFSANAAVDARVAGGMDLDSAIIAMVSDLVAAGALPLFPIIQLNAVTEASFSGFMATLNGLLASVGSAFSANPQPTLSEMLTAALVPGYMQEGLSATDASSKTSNILAAGRLDAVSINGTLDGFYQAVVDTVTGVPGSDVDATFAGLAASNPALAGLTLTRRLPDTLDDGTGTTLTEFGQLTTDPSWGFSGFGVSNALLGKQSLFASGGLGARYFMVKPTYDLYTAFRSLVSGDRAYDDAWGLQQTLSITSDLAVSDAWWNILGSSVSFTSLVLDASPAPPGSTDPTAGALDNALTALGVSASTLPRVPFYLNLDHWDGFPVRRTVLMDDPTGALATTLKAANVVVISGDIHANFASDHGTSLAKPGDNNRAVEFTVAGVSSSSFGRFVGNRAAAIVSPDDPVAGLAQGFALASQLDTFVGIASPTIDADGTVKQLKWSDTSVNGIAIMEVNQNQLTTSYYMLSDMPGLPTDIAATTTATSFYDNPAGLDDLWTKKVFRVQKVNGANGPVEDITS